MNPGRHIPVEMQEEVLPQILRIQPPAWKNSVAQLFKVHWGKPYFYALQITKGDYLLGIGELMLLGTSAWLGNIVVDPNFQRQGIGNTITKALMAEAEKRNAKTQFLLATIEGKPLYDQLGFKLNSNYLFYQNNRPPFEAEPNPTIRPFTPDQLETIFRLDAAATGEDRSAILTCFLENAQLYWGQGEVQGFYLPTMGDGLVIAQTEAAGIALLQKRASEGRTFVALPEENTFANQYLSQQGYTVFRQACLMHLGPMKNWQAEMIYSRIGGYLG